MKWIISLVVALAFLASCACSNSVTRKRREQSESVVIVTVMTALSGWSGTGFSISADVDGATILTNKHVCSAQGNGSYVLTDYAGRKYEARFIRQDEGADLCILHTRAIVVPVKLASRNAVKGDGVSAIGAPHGQYPWFTSGVVSGRTWVEMEEVHFWAQGTSIPVYPGNSGSPVFNDAGEVVGIIFAGRQDAEHMTYMVPVSEINRMLDTSENIYSAR